VKSGAEETPSEISDVVPFQESRQLSMAEHIKNSVLGCPQSPLPKSLRLSIGKKKRPLYGHV